VKWTSVAKETPKPMVPIFLCVNNKLADGYYVNEVYYSIMNGHGENVKPSHWAYWEDVPMPEKDCGVACELCKNRHAAYHIPK
jgi:hypothetical protein